MCRPTWNSASEMTLEPSSEVISDAYSIRASEMTYIMVHDTPRTSAINTHGIRTRSSTDARNVSASVLTYTIAYASCHGLR
jgi:hypothetical protein